MIDLHKLRVFFVVAQEGSFSAAAERLYITQSAVSHAIKSLEQELDCRLFDRLGRSVKLTPAGVQLLDRAQHILNEMKIARADLAELGK